MRLHPLANRPIPAALVGVLTAVTLATTCAPAAQAAVRRDTTPPVLSWKSPAAGAILSGILWEPATSGPSGPCETPSSDNVGVAKVVYSVDGVALNTENFAPYNCKFDTKAVADGSHTLKAVAYDAAGNTATSLRTVTVKNVSNDTTAPTVAWKTPASGATISGILWEPTRSGPSGPCETTSSDNVGVAKVVYSVDGTALNTENFAPYNCKFDTTTVADGSHTLKAVAYDGFGNTATATRTVTVKNVPDDTTPPTVSWSTPAAGATVSGVLSQPATSGPSGPCEATASDNIAVAKIAFSVDGAALNTQDVTPYNCNLDTTTLTDGSHTLKAVAYDGAGNSTTSTRTVTVKNTPDDTSAPTVDWSTPAAGATVAGLLWDAAGSGPSGPCQATAADNVAVTNVDFSVDGSALNSDATSPYNCKFDTTTVADGSHTLKAVAYDAAGNSTTSTRTVTVTNAPVPPPGDTTPPTVSWTAPAEGATVYGFMWESSNSGPSGVCQVSASDSVGVAKVMFYLDGSLLNTESYASYNCKFDTTLVPNGSHTLKAVAYDAAGNTASSQRTVNVQNAVAPPIDKPLLFEDNFDGASVNLTNWAQYNSPGHAGNGLRRPSAFSQSNGNLVITATWDGTNITSGGMRHRFDQAYGSYEFRVRTEADTTGQLSGVVLTWPLSNKKIPDGENDIYETGHSTARNPFYTYIHYSTDGTTDRQYRFVQTADATQWHIMRMDWTATSIKIYRDGVLVWTLTDTAAIPDTPHHLGIQLDAFSNRALPGPVKMYVDWARVYGK